jgi:CheY-like chemotaxis protein
MATFSDPGVILIVDDQEDDVILMRLSLKKGGVENPIYDVRSGEEAIDYLTGGGKYQDRDRYPLPTLILLDLKMHGIDGFDVLRWIRKQPGLGSTRVIVLTSSTRMQDVNQAYQLGANSFLVKHPDFDQFNATCLAIKNYWLIRDQQPLTARPIRQTPTDGTSNGPAAS